VLAKAFAMNWRSEKAPKADRVEPTSSCGITYKKIENLFPNFDRTTSLQTISHYMITPVV
jgi:hypothetical protein